VYEFKGAVAYLLQENESPNAYCGMYVTPHLTFPFHFISQKEEREWTSPTPGPTLRKAQLHTQKN
jgi:hypothetical protein